MMADYHEIREKLMHSNGTTALTTFATVVPSFFYTFIVTTVTALLMSYYSFGKISRFFLEFILLIIPLVLNLTILSKYVIYTITHLFAASLLLFTLVCNFGPAQKRISVDRSYNDFVTNARSAISVLSVIAILAVDFHVFPRHFTKTVTYGYSLMDLGVGLYVFSNGIVAPEVGNKRDPVSKSFRSSLPLIILGITRCFITKEIDYHVPISEYGVHWNFFMTLAVTKIFSSLILNIVKIKYLYINALLLIISHEVFLQSGLKNLVFGNVKRDNIFLANREGLVSCIGYVGLYLMSVSFGYVLTLRNMFLKLEKRSIMIKKFAILSSLCLGLSLLLQSQFGISRRLANSAYCFWVLFIGLFMTGLFYSAEAIQRSFFKGKLTQCFFTPFIFEAINYNGLAFFLTSNLLTGLINVICDTLKVDNLTSIIIIVFYMFINCIVVCILYVKQLKLKL